MQRYFMPEGRLFSTVSNRRTLSSKTNLEAAAERGEIIEGLALNCDTAHNLTVDLGCMKGVIPRLEGAVGIKEGTVRDIALISRVGKPICFVIDGFTTNSRGEMIALLSRRKAQELCFSQLISRLKAGDIIEARVTHLEPFGAFCDIGCGCVALLPIDTISVSRISHPKDRFRCGDDIKAIIKSIVDGKITLSQKELLGTWEQNAELFSTGETVSGIVRSVENYGIFVELAPNLAGLAELKSGVAVGQNTSVYIKSILPDKMKVKLIIIDSFYSPDNYLPIKYFVDEGHIDSWQYSPKSCSRVISTEF